MPRKGRLHVPGGCYHLLGRGFERRNIFREIADKRDFLQRLARSLGRSQAQCLAWAIMSNHYHLLIRIGSQPLSKLMAPLLGGYASNYNKRHDRSGYVFQNRFQSILCDEGSYLLELVRYIHLNPIRVSVIDDLATLDRYPWTGHSGLVTNNCYDWHVADEVLCHFGQTSSKARSAYRQFIKDGVNKTYTDDFSGGGLIRSAGSWESVKKTRKEHRQCIGDERILGHSGFVEKALAEDKLKIDSRTARAQEGWNLELLIRRVCAAYEVEVSNLVFRARKNRLACAKSLICYWGAEELGLTLTEIGCRLAISQQSVSRWCRQGKQLVEAEGLKLESLSA